MFCFFDSYNSDFQTSANDSRATLYGVKHGNLKMNISVVSNIPDDKKGIADESKKAYAAALFEMTDGIEMTRDNFVNEALIHIYGEIPNKSTTYSMGVFATNWREVKLEAPITEKYLDLSGRDISSLDESDLEGCADTDRDGLYDFQEIRFTYNGYTMKFNEDGTPELWSLDALRELNDFNDIPTYGYVEKFVEKIKKENIEEYYEFLTTPILLLKSDPTSKDGDYDGIDDVLDKFPLSQTVIPQLFKNLICDELVNYDDIVKVSDNCYVCKKSVVEFLYDEKVVNEILKCYEKINSDDIKFIIECLLMGNNGADDKYDYCIASTYAGKEDIYFIAPIDSSDLQLKVMAAQNTDIHRKNIINNSDLKNNESYAAIKLYTDVITLDYEFKEKMFDERLEYHFNTHGFVEISDYYSPTADFFTSTFDSFYQSLCKSIYSLYTVVEGSAIEVSVYSVRTSYMEYEYWYRQQYPEQGNIKPVYEYASEKVTNMFNYIVLDIDTRLIHGTPQSRGEVFGEFLCGALIDAVAFKLTCVIFDDVDNVKYLNKLDEIKSKTNPDPIDIPTKYSAVNITVDGKRFDFRINSKYHEVYYEIINSASKSFRSIFSELDDVTIDKMLEFAYNNKDSFKYLISKESIPTSSYRKFLKFDGSKSAIDELFFTGEGKRHFATYDGFDKKNNGIKGCHTLDELRRLEKIESISEKERLIKIISEKEIGDGIYEIKYAIAEKDGKGNYVMKMVDGKEDYTWIRQSNPYTKTVVDTSTISVSDAEKMAKQAFASRNIEAIFNQKDGSYSFRIKGISDNGIEFVGWIDMEKWEIVSFYPQLQE